MQAYLSIPTLQPENIHDTSGQLGFVWQHLLFSIPPGKGEWEGYKVHSFKNIHSRCKPLVSLQMQNQSTKKMMRHQFSSNTGVIKKTINIYRANESKEITKCVFSNALLMWCLLCIYKQEQICLVHEMKVVWGESENVLERMISIRMFWVMLPNLGFFKTILLGGFEFWFLSWFYLQMYNTFVEAIKSTAQHAFMFSRQIYYSNSFGN